MGRSCVLVCSLNPAFQRFHPLHGGIAPVSLADELLIYLAMPVDDVRLRILEGAIGRADLRFLVEPRLKFNLVPSEEFFVRGLVPVRTDPEYDNTGISHLPGEIVERGHFFDTRRAPAAPEMQ